MDLAQYKQIFNEWLNIKLLVLGNVIITPANIIKVILIVIIAYWLSVICRRMLDRVALKRPDTLRESTLYNLKRLLHYCIITIGFIAGLSFIGLDFSNLAIVAGALGVGIGFGLQSIANNFISGLIVLFERHINVGDFVELQSGTGGTIKEINVRSTLITTPDNLDVIIPNSEFITSQVTNWTLRDRYIRVHIPFGVAYGSDKVNVKQAALEAADQVSFTYKSEKKEPLVWLTNFGDSSLDFELVVWVDTKGIPRPGAIKSTYLWELETALNKYGITIPFPQRDLHLKSGLEKFSSN